MEIKYKPTKPKKEKPFKAPKAEKAAKPMSFGSAQSVKIDKPKKVKEPKAPKPEKLDKAVSFTPTKVEKAAEFKSSGKLPMSVNPKILAAALSVVALVVILVVVVLPFLNRVEEGGTTDTKSVTITQLPNKTEFYVGDSPSYAGLQVKVTMDNGLSFTVDQYKCTLSGFDSSKPNEAQKITVTYDGVSTSYTIIIKDKPGEGEGGNDSSGFFNGLSIKTMPKTECKVGDWPSVEGGVLLLQYDNGDTKEIPMEIDYIYGFNTSAPGTYTVTVKYVEDGYLATCQYTITVTE